MTPGPHPYTTVAMRAGIPQFLHQITGFNMKIDRINYFYNKLGG